MKESKTPLRGGVILIGSLLWENEQNRLGELEFAKARREWREENLDLSKITHVNLPIAYGRCSESRLFTYTMVFSTDHKSKDGKGVIVPFKDSIDFSDEKNFPAQVEKLAVVEGICKEGKKIYSKDWGTIALWINRLSSHTEVINKLWNLIRIPEHGFGSKFSTYDYKMTPEGGYKVQFESGSTSIYEVDGKKLIRDDYTIPFLHLPIKTDLDFLLCVYTKPKNRDEFYGRKWNSYPSSKEIAEQMIYSGYHTYFAQNRANGIVTVIDKEIMIDFVEIKRPLKADEFYESGEWDMYDEVLWNDRDFVMEQVKRRGDLLKKAANQFKDDKEIVLQAVSKNGFLALEHASIRLKADKEIVLAAVKSGLIHRIYEHVSAELLSDKEFIKDILPYDSSILQYVPDGMFDDIGSKEL